MYYCISDVIHWDKNMSFDFDNNTPIYLQIIEDIKIKIISKKILPNQKLLSVREMSLEYGVNPNTIQKSLMDLEDMGLIYTERTNGKYVTGDEKLIQKIKQEIIKLKVQDFLSSMHELGLSQEEIIEILMENKYEYIKS